MDQIIERCQSIGFSCFDNTIKYCTRIGATGTIRKKPVFSANDEGFYCSLCSIIVDIEITILYIANQFLPLIQIISDGFANSRFGGCLQSRFIQPDDLEPLLPWNVELEQKIQVYLRGRLQ